jgi:hypothetical protein
MLHTRSTSGAPLPARPAVQAHDAVDLVDDHALAFGETGMSHAHAIGGIKGQTLYFLYYRWNKGTDTNGTGLRPLIGENGHEKPGILGWVECEKTSPFPAGSLD